MVHQTFLFWNSKREREGRYPDDRSKKSVGGATKLDGAHPDSTEIDQQLQDGMKVAFRWQGRGVVTMGRC